MSIELAEDFDIKSYIFELCRLGVKSNSKEISAFLIKKGFNVSWQTVAAYKAAYVRQGD